MKRKTILDQRKLFDTSPLANVPLGTRQLTLGNLLDAWDAKLLVPAPFQRKYIWKPEQKQEWADTLATMPVDCWGTFCSYRLLYGSKPDGVYYLADGYQRISCTLEILSNPSEWGFEMSGEELRSKLRWWFVDFQNSAFQDHFEGFVRFQKVNNGTKLEPAEFFKGYLTNLPYGEQLIDRLVRSIKDCDNRVAVIAKNNNNARELKFERGCYALFYQYISKTTQQDFWKYAASKIHRNGVEELLAKELNGSSRNTVMDMIDQFTRYINGLTATIEQSIYQAYDNEIGHAINRAVFRALLHLGIYKKNSGWSTDSYLEALQVILQCNKKKSSHIWYEVDGKEVFESVATHSLYKVMKCCRDHGIETSPNVRRKRQTSLIKSGYDHSHYLPVSTHGEGETFPEPSPINRARGAKPIEGYEDTHS